jgi:hypothetical protein
MMMVTSYMDLSDPGMGLPDEPAFYVLVLLINL